MGTEFSSSSKCTITILNFSNIYLSPFEFYGIDNWEQLQGIGKIFEEQLKEDYSLIMSQSKKIIGDNKNYVFSQHYDRSNFQWHIGDIGKQFTVQRYTPLYPSQQYLQKEIAGIKKQSQNQCLQDRDQFLQSWDKRFDEAFNFKNQKAAKTQAEHKLYRFQCKYFDYLCYKAIVIYLYKKINRGQQLFIDYRTNSQARSFDNLVDQQRDKGHHDLICAYKDFLYRYGKRIPKNKEEFTIDHLFKRRSLEIIILCESSEKLIQQLQKKPQYFSQQARKGKQTKKTLLLVKKNLPFTNFISQEKKQHNESTYGIIPKILVQQFQSQNRAIILQQLTSFYDLKIKSKSPSPSDQVKVDKFLKQLKQHGFIEWIYQQGNFNRYQGKDGKEVYIGAFHFSSHMQLNQLQIQVLGLILFHLVCREKAKFIVAGDFNSFVSLDKRDNHLGLFSFVRQMAEKSKEVSQTQISAMINQMDIFPKNSKMTTTKKKRTMLQPQFKKINLLAQQCRDQIITNYKFVKKTSHICEIGDIGTRKTDNQNFLPNAGHPYDHFAIEATLDLS